MGETLSFGAYGWYVWPSIGLFVATVGALIAQTLIASAAARRTVRRLEAEEAERGRA